MISVLNITLKPLNTQIKHYLGRKKNLEIQMEEKIDKFNFGCVCVCFNAAKRK